MYKSLVVSMCVVSVTELVNTGVVVSVCGICQSLKLAALLYQCVVSVTESGVVLSVCVLSVTESGVGLSVYGVCR